jgi:hypothetical protein
MSKANREEMLKVISNYFDKEPASFWLDSIYRRIQEGKPTKIMLDFSVGPTITNYHYETIH